MPTGLGVHDHDLATSVDEAGEEIVGLVHHEVGLEGNIGGLATGTDHVGAER